MAEKAPVGKQRLLVRRRLGMLGATRKSRRAMSLQQTLFHATHHDLGAQLVPFAGYSMPLHYPTGILAEHHAVRRGCGLFDVSHMGVLRLSGREAASL